MSDDDTTDWFRPRRPDDQPGEGAPPAPQQPAATEPLRPADAAAPDAGAPDAGEDGLSALFGDQPDSSDEAWDTPTSAYDAGGEAATQVNPAATASDPLAWLGEAPRIQPDPDAPTAVYGANAVADDQATTVFGAAGAAGLGATAATTRYDGGSYLPPTGGDDGDGPAGGPNRTVLVLAIIGGVLLLGLIIALIVYFTSSATTTPKKTAEAGDTTSSSPSASSSASASATPSETPTPSATPTPTPTPTKSVAPPPPAPAPDASISSFATDPTNPPVCLPDSTSVPFTLDWATSNAKTVTISGPGASGAVAGSGSSVLQFDCTATPQEQKYTLVATNADGKAVQKDTLVTPTAAG